ncbi:hypothetical protein KIPB_003535 [Kipferlia bialata]|uniref:Uncharacterized protein n=1 Tax=Kipferlia bialata TaxID=797122 RepID=A0A9K3CSB8_9EUKA|nr:hypothetical protein KIPB_003535 [Kipferlia bialata]|eukprot:g3535.t1
MSIDDLGVTVSVSEYSFPRGLPYPVDISVNGETTLPEAVLSTLEVLAVVDSARYTAVLDSVTGLFTAEVVVWDALTFTVEINGVHEWEFPVRTYPLFSRVTELDIPTDPVSVTDPSNDARGMVAVGEECAVVGDPTLGFAYIYRRINLEWTQTERLGTGTAGFGSCVAIDGSCIAVCDTASVQVFAHHSESDQWEVAQVLPLGDSGDTCEVQALDLRSGLLIAHYSDEDGSQVAGFLLESGSGAWLAVSLPYPGSSDTYSVATDGSQIVLGGTTGSTGFVVVYQATSTETMSTWDETLRLSGGATFGSRVAIHDDVLAVAETQENDAQTSTVHTFSFDNGSWQTGPSIHGFVCFGSSLSVRHTTLVVGSPGSTVDAPFGSVKVYQRRSNSVPLEWEEIWAGTGMLLDGFGSSVSLWSDTLLILAMPSGTDDTGSIPFLAFIDSRWGEDIDPVEVRFSPSSSGTSSPSLRVSIGLGSYVQDASAVSLGYHSDGGTPANITGYVSHYDQEVVFSYMGYVDFFVPGELVTVTIFGTRYVSDHVAVISSMDIATTIVCVDPRSEDLYLIITNTGETRNIIGVYLGESHLEPQDVNVRFGDGDVSTCTTVWSEEDGLRATFEHPLALPPDWQRGAQGSILPIPTLVWDFGTDYLDGTVKNISESFVAWVPGSDLPAIPVVGAVVQGDFTGSMNGCGTVDISLYDANMEPISCGTAGVGVLEYDGSTSEPVFMFSVDDSYATLKYCLPYDSFGVGSLAFSSIVVTFEGTPILHIPISTGSWGAVILVFLVGATMAVCAISGLIKSHSPELIGEREQPSSTGHDIHPELPYPTEIYTIPEDDPTVGHDTSTRTLLDRGVHVAFVALDVAIFSALKLFMLSGSFFVVLRTVGLFTPVWISGALLTRYPVVKYAFRLTMFLDNISTAAIQYLVSENLSPMLFVTLSAAVMIMLVCASFMNWQLLMRQTSMTVRKRVLTYAIFFTLNFSSDIVASIMADTTLWYIAAGSSGWRKEAAICVYSGMVAIAFVLLAFMGEESKTLRCFVTEAWDSIWSLCDALSLRKRLIQSTYSGNAILKVVSSTIRATVFVVLSPLFFTYVLYTPVAASLLFVLQAATGVHNTVSLKHGRRRHATVCVLTSLYLSSAGSAAPEAAAWVMFSLISSLIISLILSPKNDFDPYAMTAARISSLNERVSDDCLDVSTRDSSESERLIELHLTLKSSALLVVPIVGPILVVLADMLCSPPLRFAAVRTPAFNWFTNLLSFGCIVVMVMFGQSEAEDIFEYSDIQPYGRVIDYAVCLFIVLQVFDVTQEERVVTEHTRLDIGRTLKSLVRGDGKRVAVGTTHHSSVSETPVVSIECSDGESFDGPTSSPAAESPPATHSESAPYGRADDSCYIQVTPAASSGMDSETGQESWSVVPGACVDNPSDA